MYITGQLCIVILYLICTSQMLKWATYMSKVYNNISFLIVRMSTRVQWLLAEVKDRVATVTVIVTVIDSIMFDIFFRCRVMNSDVIRLYYDSEGASVWDYGIKYTTHGHCPPNVKMQYDIMALYNKSWLWSTSKRLHLRGAHYS